MTEMEEVAKRTSEALASGMRIRAMMAECLEHLRKWHPTDLTPIPLARAVCHPILGGILRVKDGADVPGPTFTENSLGLAISKGHLKCTWVAGKRHVTPAALKEWLATSNDTRSTATTVVAYVPPQPRTHYEKKQAEAIVGTATAKLISLKAALAKKKKGGK